MIDLASGEKLLSREQAGELIGRTIDPVTWWRWRTRGVGGRKLESITIGGRTFTTAAALQRFAVPGGDSEPPPMRSPARRQREIAAAEKACEELGI